MRSVAAAVVLLAAAFAACGNSEPPPEPVTTASEVVHVHGLGRDPADGALLIATHTGLFRITAGQGAPSRIGKTAQDTMGFTVVGPRRYLGSGHPEDVTRDPPFLGLIESRDGGETWRPVSLRGEVDFHVLEARGGTIYGYGSDWESREPRFLRSVDGGRKWTRLVAPEPLVGMAIDPDDPRRLVAAGEERTHLSTDAGASWRPIADHGGFVVWTRELGLIAIDLSGQVRHADGTGADWEPVGSLGEPPAAAEGVAGEVLAATHSGRILTSRDGGATWRDVIARG